MATVIHEASRVKELLPSVLVAMLPYRLVDEIRSLGPLAIEEIRLRSNRAVFLTTESGNRRLRTVMSRMELESVLQAVCDGSLYAHSETITQGYVTIEGGIRVGVCGRATVEGGRVIGVYGISGINLRLPSRRRRVGQPICRLLRSLRGEGGVLIYSAPGVGKTTLLRSLAAELARGECPLRVAVVDSRGELAPFLDDPSLSVDLLSGYPKAEGIAIACRTMNAQLIVCDEIGERAEAEAIVASQNCGVPLVATAHASTLEGLLRRTTVRELHRAHVFSYYVGIVRCARSEEYSYTVTDWEGADVAFQAGRRVDACV